MIVSLTGFQAKNTIEKLERKLQHIESVITECEKWAQTAKGRACCGHAFITFNEVHAAKETLEYYEGRKWYVALVIYRIFCFLYFVFCILFLSPGFHE